MSGASGPVTAREVLTLLRRWQARLLAGEAGLPHVINWACLMRARVPAFEGFSGGEIALLSLGVVHALRAQMAGLTLATVVEQLAEIGVSAIAVSGLHEKRPSAEETEALAEAQRAADRLALPLLSLTHAETSLAEVEREIIELIVARRERYTAASEPTAADAARLRASLRGEALDALLTGTYVDETAMRARAAQLGYDLTQPHAVLWVELAPMDGSANAAHLPLVSPGAAATAQARASALAGGVAVVSPVPQAAQSSSAGVAATRLAEEVTTALGAWARARDTHVAALLALPRGEGAALGSAEVAERAATLLLRALGDGATSGDAPWAAGLGEPASAPSQVYRSATEAHDAARLGLRVLGPHHVARPTDLGVYRLLLALRERGELAHFVERTLAPLLTDARAGDALIETLDAFFACNGNLSEAARRLHLHRNSLIYRLARARGLLGHDLDDPELRLALQLAIKGRLVLER